MKNPERLAESEAFEAPPKKRRRGFGWSPIKYFMAGLYLLVLLACMAMLYFSFVLLVMVPKT